MGGVPLALAVLFAPPAFASSPDADAAAVLALVKAARERVKVVAPVAAPAVVPPGMHAHVRADGSVIVHADSNYGDPVAHAGIVWPWVKTATAGQPVPRVQMAAPFCPPGGR